MTKCQQLSLYFCKNAPDQVYLKILYSVCVDFSGLNKHKTGAVVRVCFSLSDACYCREF
jgi:hypothetical protein